MTSLWRSPRCNSATPRTPGVAGPRLCLERRASRRHHELRAHASHQRKAENIGKKGSSSDGLVRARGKLEPNLDARGVGCEAAAGTGRGPRYLALPLPSGFEPPGPLRIRPRFGPLDCYRIATRLQLHHTTTEAHGPLGNRWKSHLISQDSVDGFAGGEDAGRRNHVDARPQARSGKSGGSSTRHESRPQAGFWPRAPARRPKRRRGQRACTGTKSRVRSAPGPPARRRMVVGPGRPAARGVQRLEGREPFGKGPGRADLGVHPIWAAPSKTWSAIQLGLTVLLSDPGSS